MVVQLMCIRMLKLFVGVVLFPWSGAQAAIPCQDDATCEALLRPGSKCKNNACTNPFSGGCLRRVLGEEKVKDILALPLRSCNSDDSSIAGVASDSTPSQQCSNSDFDYPEVRISNGNWESSMFMAWILQIILSEVMGQPSTIETGKGDGSPNSYVPGSSFYDSDLGMAYASATYNWGGLYEAASKPNGDCRTSTSGNCHHVIPEVWSGQIAEWTAARENDAIEPMSSIDAVGRLALFMPSYTAKKDPSLAFVAGLGGEKNRKKLAETFKRPTTWGQYCKEFSPTNCTSPEDEYATRKPDEAEEGKYYSAGTYRGYFHASEENDCEENPDTCTGHYVNAPCEWSTFTDSQFYWNKVALESGGSKGANNGYGYFDMIDIWNAANETKSDVIMFWYRPDWLVQLYRGTDAEFVPVTLTEPSIECINARLDVESRCSSDPAVRRGTPEGACDYEASVLRMAISSELDDAAQSVSAPSRSAAHLFLRNFAISGLAIDKMLKDWYTASFDRYGYDPREVVCSWVADNIDELRRFVPAGYPRKMQDQSKSAHRSFSICASVLGGLAVAATIASAVLTYLWRKKKVMVYAQPGFLFLVLLGFLLVALGAVVYSIEPNAASCVAQKWLVMLGYSLELMPLIVKVTAINRIMHQAKRMKRVTLSRTALYGVVGLVLGLVLTYMAIWTALDPSTRVEEQILSDSQNEAGGLYVEVQVGCSSNVNTWMIIAMAWQLLLLISATVLAFQTRNIRQEFNESGRLAFMIYSHFIFTVLRLVVFFLSDSITFEVAAASTSVLLSLDTLAALAIYFGHKFVAVVSKTESTLRRGSSYSFSAAELPASAINNNMSRPSSVASLVSITEDQQLNGAPSDVNKSATASQASRGSASTSDVVEKRVSFTNIGDEDQF